MEYATTALEYFKVLLSGPAVMAAIVLVFFWKFKPNIGSLIDRINKIDFPGGGIGTSQKEKVREALPEPDKQPKPEQPQLPQSVSLTPDQQKTISELLQSENIRATLWEYRYLNFFLARITQEFLDWLATAQPPPTVLLADATWSFMPTDERSAVMEALKTHGLIEVSNAQILVTEKGRGYLQWRGPLPPLQMPK
jgi:hypothetical protein